METKQGLSDLIRGYICLQGAECTWTKKASILESMQGYLVESSGLEYGWVCLKCGTGAANLSKFLVRVTLAGHCIFSVLLSFQISVLCFGIYVYQTWLPVFCPFPWQAPNMERQGLQVPVSNSWGRVQLDQLGPVIQSWSKHLRAGRRSHVISSLLS